MDISEGMPVVEAHEGLASRERACFGVLLELASTLQDWRQRICLIGGWATYVLTESFHAGAAEGPMRHRGSLDVDIAVGLLRISAEDAEVLAAKLRDANYRGPESFHWHRELPSAGVYTVDMMALPPPGHEHGVVKMGGYDFAPFWHGEGAFVSPTEVTLRGTLPSGGSGEARLRVASPGGLLVVKAWTISRLEGRPESKHLYDIFALLRTYPGGPENYPRELEALRGSEDLQVALDLLQVMFVDSDDGPRMVAEQRMGAPEEWDRHVVEARVTVQRFLRAMGRE